MSLNLHSYRDVKSSLKRHKMRFDGATVHSIFILSSAIPPTKLPRGFYLFKHLWTYLLYRPRQRHRLDSSIIQNEKCRLRLRCATFLHKRIHKMFTIHNSPKRHYLNLQLVWGDTNLVGCGFSYYQDAKYNKLYVCNYGPGYVVVSALFVLISLMFN